MLLGQRREALPGAISPAQCQVMEPVADPVPREEQLGEDREVRGGGGERRGDAGDVGLRRGRDRSELPEQQARQ